jgi:hypothetical protein
MDNAFSNGWDTKLWQKDDFNFKSNFYLNKEKGQLQN